MSPGRAASPVSKAPVPAVTNSFTRLLIDPIIDVYLVIIGEQI